MNSFFTIAFRIINVPKLSYPNEDMSNFLIHAYNNTSVDPDHFKIYNMIYDMYYLMHIGDKSHTFYTARCSIFKKVMSNIFVSEDYKQGYLFLFGKIQRCYYAFNRLAYIYKFKKTPLQVTTDLLMNPIDTGDKNSIIIYQNNAKYVFALNDLIHIIETSISNAPDFFVDIFTPKNPYTNIAFNESILYNIYVNHKMKSNTISTLFHLYFLAGFNNTKYALENEAYIRDFAIKKYVFTTPRCNLLTKIVTMLKSNLYTSRLYIHPDFPKDILVDIMRPFLYYKYLSEYGVEGTEKIKIYKKIVYYKLKQFYEYNTKFGRVYYKHVPKGRREITFNSSHIPFHLLNIGDLDSLPDIDDNYSSHNIIYLYSDTNVEQERIYQEQREEEENDDSEEPEEEEEKEEENDDSEEPQEEGETTIPPYYYYFPPPEYPISNNSQTQEDDTDSIS